MKSRTASLRSFALVAAISSFAVSVTLACSDPSNYQGGGRSGSGARQANDVPDNDAGTVTTTTDAGTTTDSATNG